MADKITLYVSKQCSPCVEIKKMVERGDVIADAPIKIVSLDTKEGFNKFNRDVLSKNDVSSIPVAYKGTQRCDLLIDKKEPNRVIVSCPTQPISS